VKCHRKSGGKNIVYRNSDGGQGFAEMVGWAYKWMTYHHHLNLFARGDIDINLLLILQLLTTTALCTHFAGKGTLDNYGKSLKL